jgi:hypothetical protein
MNAPVNTLKPFDPVVAVYLELAFDIIYSRDEKKLKYVLPEELHSLLSIQRLTNFLNKNCIPFILNRKKFIITIHLNEVDQFICDYTYSILVDYYFVQPPDKDMRTVQDVFDYVCELVLYPNDDSLIHIELPDEIQTVESEIFLAYLLKHYQIPYEIEESGKLLTITSLALNEDILNTIEAIPNEAS